MMLKGKDQIGKRVVTIDTGAEIDKVRDLVFDHGTNQVLGFLVDEQGWFSKARVVPFSCVRAIGPDAILVSSRADWDPSDTTSAVQGAVQSARVLDGTTVMTTNGRDLGHMTDLYFDDTTGRLTGYEVSGGLFADAYSGRSFVDAPQTMTFGEDVALVPVETANLLEAQVGGVRAVMQNVAGRVEKAVDATTATVRDAGIASAERAQAFGQKMSDAATDAVVAPEDQRAFALGKTTREAVLAPDGALVAAEGVVVDAEIVDAAQRHGALGRLYRATGGSAALSAWESTKSMAQDAASATSSRLASATARPTVEATEGHRVRHSVRTTQGSIIAAPGMIVSDAMIRQAREAGLEEELVDAVGLSPEGGRATAADMASRTRSAATEATDTLKAGAARATAGVGQWWDRVTEQIEHVWDRASASREQHRIQDALGRPVTRVILDREDTVILNVGELVTNKAVERARDAEMLDALLDAASTENPPLTADEYRAPSRGENALEGDAASTGGEPAPPRRADGPRQPRTRVTGRSHEER